MISRRVLLGTGATVVGVAGLLTVADLTHRLDDLARVAGLDPKREPDPADDALLRGAADDQAALLAAVRATASRHGSLRLADLETIGQEHLDALGGSTTSPDVAAAPADQSAAVSALVTAYDRAAKTRGAEAARAGSPELVLVLASMSAGLAQCARTARGLR